MAKLLYVATAADGTRTEGEVNAPSAVAAREQLERQGLQAVQLRSPVQPLDVCPQGVDANQRQALLQFRQRLVQPPTLRAALAGQVGRLWWLLALGCAATLAGLSAGWPWLVGVGLAGAAAPLAAAAWSFRYTDRHQRLLRHYALGEWAAVQTLAKALRDKSSSTPDGGFDLVVRLAGIHARERDLPAALQRLSPWRKRTARRPGAFEAGLAQVHLMAGDTAGCLAQLEQAHAQHPQHAPYILAHAWGQARFGHVTQVESLLVQAAQTVLPARDRALAQWARGMVQLRRRESDAMATLSQAMDAWLPFQSDPAAWPSLALCACDHAVALHEAGHHAAARERIAQVWPVLEAHATVPLLRMLEADDLLPVRSTPNI
jgi:hypothetical protein